MARLKHRIEYLAAAAGVSLANGVGPQTAIRLGRGFGRLACRLLSSRRLIAEDNLRRAFGSVLTDEEIAHIARGVFETIGSTLFELARFPRLTKESLSLMIGGDSGASIDEALRRGTGGVIVSPHFGNWELAAAYLAHNGYPIDLLVTTQHNHLVDDLLTRLRTSSGAGIIRMGGALRKIFKSLKSNRLVAIAPDQHAPGKNLVMDFFGRPASVAEGPAIFAVRTGAPILPFCVRRSGPWQFRVLAGPALYPELYPDEHKAVEEITRDYLGFFENCIRKYPDQWMWTHRRWKIDSVHRNNMAAEA